MVSLLSQFYEYELKMLLVPLDVAKRYAWFHKKV